MFVCLYIYTIDPSNNYALFLWFKLMVLNYILKGGMYLSDLIYLTGSNLLLDFVELGINFTQHLL
jgi:hypothetical protein